jgi:hypothetical protein
VNNALHAGDDFLDLGQIGEVGGDKVFVLAKIGRRTDVARADSRIDTLQKPASACTDIAGGAGDQDFLHDCHWIPFSAASLS